MIAFFLTLVAVAFGTDVTVCAELRVNFTDVNSVTTELDDDYIRTNDNVPARGVTITADDNVDSSHHEVTLPDADPACGVLTGLTPNHAHNLKLFASANLNGNSIIVYNNDTDNLVWAYQADLDYIPNASVTKEITTGTHRAWNVLAASTWALHRRNAGLSGKLFKFFTQECPTDAGNSCLHGGALYIFPDDAGGYSHGHHKYKTMIAHEMGHKVAALNGGAGASAKLSVGDPSDSANCPEGDITSKQYASYAAKEGIATYWAAVAFNSTTDTNCELYAPADLNGNDNWPVAKDNEKTPSCQGDPVQESWADEDFIGNECSGILEDRGTELDYLRAFWDADNGQGLTTEQIFNLWSDASPGTWDVNGGGGTDDVEERLADAAFWAGVVGQWSIVASANGIR